MALNTVRHTDWAAPAPGPAIPQSRQTWGLRAPIKPHNAPLKGLALVLTRSLHFFISTTPFPRPQLQAKSLRKSLKSFPDTF